MAETRGIAQDDGRPAEARRMTPAAVRVLETASRLFYEQGIRAVGVEAIAAEAGVTKKTLYDRFGSKEDLVVAYLRTRDERWRRGLTEQVAELGGSPRESILATFQVLRHWMRENNPRGCAFVNASVELPADHAGQSVAREQKTWLLDYLRELTTAAGVRDPAGLAAQLLILHDGACVAHSMDSVDEATRRAEQIAAVLVDAGLPT